MSGLPLWKEFAAREARGFIEQTAAGDNSGALERLRDLNLDELRDIVLLLAYAVSGMHQQIEEKCGLDLAVVIDGYPVRFHRAETT